MGTIVKFKPNIDYYYTRGLNEYESDNFIDALKSYREAYRLAENCASDDFRTILEVEMACCYRNLNLLRETQLMYYKSLTGNPNPDAAFDSVLGLIDLFGTHGNDEALKYYMEVAAKKGFSRELDYIDTAAQFFSQCDYKVEPSPDRNMYELGKKLLETGQFDFSRQILEVIPPDSSAYGEACVKLASLCNDNGEHEKALEYAEIAEKLCPSTENKVNTVLALHGLKRTAEFEEALEDLASVEADDVVSLVHIIRVMAIIGSTENVIKFGSRLSRISPQKAPMLCYAVALSNSGELREARKVMVTLQALYPYDAGVRVFSRLISNLTEKSDFSLLCELPEDTESEILSTLNAVLSECDNNKVKLKARLRDPDLHTGVLMVFQLGSDNSKRLLCDLVADIPFFERYMRDCLMDPCYPDSDKRIILPVAIKKFKKRPVYLTCRDICRPLKGAPPAKTSGKWRDVYSLAYSAIALFGTQDYEKQFDCVFGQLKDALDYESGIDEIAAAAVLVNRLNVISVLSGDECCIELFGADKEKYFKYKALLQSKRNKNNKDKE